MDPRMPLSDMTGIQNMGLAMPDMLDDPALMAGLDADMLPMDLDFDHSFETMAAAGPHPHLPQQESGESTNTVDFMQQAQHGDGSGAGPLPTGFGMGSSAPGIAVTDFTKRRNWSQRVIEELKDFLHILTPDGRILYVSPSCKSITGYEPQELVGKFINEYIHPDDGGIFMREFHESIASSNPLRFFYRFRKSSGSYVIFECDGHPHISSDVNMMAYNNMGMNGNGAQTSGVTCKGFFMMSRPYPTRNAALLDSFLEHKIENERLLKKIEELKREEQEETDAQERQWQESTAASDTQGGMTSTGDPNLAGRTPNHYQGMPPPAKPSISNIALTRQNLDSALSSQRPDSIADKMSRYEGANHVDTIEMLTGLQFREGERSRGISTGDTSPALIRGDAGIAIAVDRDRESALKEKKKKVKVADEYVCADCGTLDSPEWRKGPKGPKTLCNACGLRWAKKEKKRAGPQDVSGGGGGSDSMGGGGGVGGSSTMGTPGTFNKMDLNASL